MFLQQPSRQGMALWPCDLQLIGYVFLLDNINVIMLSFLPNNEKKKKKSENRDKDKTKLEFNYYYYFCFQFVSNDFFY